VEVIKLLLRNKYKFESTDLRKCAILTGLKPKTHSRDNINRKIKENDRAKSAGSTAGRPSTAPAGVGDTGLNGLVRGPLA
jgi:hypothetical protein